MAKKNFDDFVMAAGKRKKPTPDEVDEWSKILHPVKNIEVEASLSAKTELPITPEKPAVAPQKPSATKKAAPEIEKKSPPKQSKKIVGKEKVRITVDLDKDLYRKLKMQVIHEETDLSSYLRELLQKNLPK